MTKILLADAHPLTHMGVQTFLAGEGYETIYAAKNADQALSMAAQHQPQVVILDVDLPGSNGIQLVCHLMALNYPVHVIVFTAQKYQHLAYICLQAGATGLVYKTAPLEQLLNAIESAELGHAWFPCTLRNITFHRNARFGAPEDKITRCERTVMSLLLQGKLNNEISALLNRSPKTISAQKKSLLKKLNVGSIAELMLLMSIQTAEA
ncbi:response regulator transcription factor [Rahnella woolbedingensis]|uniref:DNA-binding response regulator n=1 Tax=Rahnella woolbedingensis TaxID=1510574 RepID=A0A419N831_9GAMM|nr:response regulator transcription factor [Rahnella woolbedingensis]RJT43417.1 DNA-binding response regulator [Rahnella woolbedingensis]